MKAWRLIAACTLAGLILSLFMFAPRLWLMRMYVPGTFQWDRAHTYLLQCEAPFRRDIEPAMFWRLLPPLICHGIGLRGYLPLVVPWLGVIAATGYVTLLFRRRLDNPRFVFSGALLFATTSAVIVSTTWLGLNDAWVWLGLLAIAFGRTKWSCAVASLLCPWIDERFVLGFPLAWMVRCLDRDEPFFSRAAWQILWLLPYLLLRAALGGVPAGNDASAAFLRQTVDATAVLVPFAPLGWWMALRVGWLAVAYGVWSLSCRRRVLAVAVVAGTLAVMLCIASDISRSTAIVTPAMLWGCFVFARRNPAHAPRGLLTLAVINLLVPAAHVIYTKIDVINPLVIELIRLWRIP